MEFWQLVRIVRRSWKLIGILVVVCVVLSLFLNLTKVKLYDASSLIQVSFSTTNPIEGTPDYETKFTLFGTIQQAATSDLALRTVAQKNGLATDNIKNLRQTIKVLPVEKSEYLKITVTAGSEKQAVGVANDLAAYVKEAANRRWLDQLTGILSYSEGQLKIAQDNYQGAIQNYDDAKKKYSDLEAKALQDDSDTRTKQIADANNKVIAAQDNYAKANSTIPKDSAAIELAKGTLDRAQRDLDALQQAALAPVDAAKQAQRTAELNQNSGLDDALNRQKAAKGKVDELQGQIDLAKSLQNYPDLHAASVTIVDPAKSGESQSSQLPLFVGAAVAVALMLGIVLAVLINYLDRGLHSVGSAREIYRQPVLAGIPLFRPDKKAKNRLANLNLKGKAEATPVAEPVSAEELMGMPEYAMESFRMLANSVVGRHHNEIPEFAMAPVRAALPAGVTSSDNAPEGEASVKTNGNGKGNGHGLALAEMSEVRDMVIDSGGTTQPRPLGLLVAANAAGAGKTTVVANLGTALAEAGYRTLLVDCNRRNPALLSSFGLNDNGNGNGKNKDKKKKDQPEQHVGEPGRIYNTEYPELDLLPYSSLPTQASGVVRLGDMAALLHKVEGDYQLVICDTPALNEASDAVALAQHFPNVIYVVDGRNANVALDQEKLQSLTTGNGSLEGLVVNWMQKQS